MPTRRLERPAPAGAAPAVHPACRHDQGALRGHEVAHPVQQRANRIPPGPAMATPGRRSGLLDLQRVHGNWAAQRLLGLHALPVGPDADRHERAADACRPSAGTVPTGAAERHPRSTGGPVGEPAARALAASEGRRLPDAVRSAVARWAVPGPVWVHNDAAADRASRALDAEALTVGRDVYFRRGAYDPASWAGRDTLAHELTHVAQQDGGAPVVQRKKFTNAPAAVQQAKARLKQSLGPGSAKEIAKRLTARVPGGPPLTRQDVDDVKTLSQHPEGRDWLRDTELGTAQSAVAYLQRGKYDISRTTKLQANEKWVALPRPRQLLMASMALFADFTRNQDNPSPAYTLGRQMAITHNRATPAAEQERDTHMRNAFVGTLRDMFRDPAHLGQIATQENQPQAYGQLAVDGARILAKVFFILQAGLQVYDPVAAQHIDYQGEVFRALAHGGRVNIRIPQLQAGEHARDLPEWMGLTRNADFDQGPSEARKYATHDIEIGRNLPGQRGRFEETGGAMANRRRKSHTRLRGLNVAAGGVGSHDVNGDVVLPDGRHGHMFIGFTPPTNDRDGALQIGIETVGPGGTSPVGYHHGPTSSEKTASPESSYYGHKSAKIGGGGLATNQRYVDLAALNQAGRTWQEALLEIEQDWWDLVNQATSWQERNAAIAELVGTRRY